MATFPRDDNYVPIQDKDGLIITKEYEFVVDTTGTVDAHTLFKISGPCIAKVIGLCTVDLDSDGVATAEVGIDGTTTAFIAQTTATTIDTGEFWIDATPSTVETDFAGKMIDSVDIILTIGTEAIKAGKIIFYCYWRPMSAASTIEAA